MHFSLHARTDGNGGARWLAQAGWKPAASMLGRTAIFSISAPMTLDNSYRVSE
ncbi:hypothetical protein [Zymomonas mobilis]|uniref:hypothetical protein n=1 Tax=Zymomonas mobilis TaxID=542 RepID=UPI0039E959D4